MSLVNFSINDSIVSVPYETAINSVIIKQLLVNVSNGDPIPIPIPSKFEQAISNYKSFLFGDKPSIDNAYLLLECFKFANYLEDNNYFNYLLTHLFEMWSEVSFIVYGDDISNQLRYDILQHCPFDFLPQKFRNDNVFIGQWLELNQNKTVIVNGNTMYHINEIDNINEFLIPTSSQEVNLISYHVVCDQGRRNILKYIWCKDITQTKQDFTPLINLVINDKRQGPWKEWYTSHNRQLKSKGYYDNDKKHGLWEEWYNNGHYQRKGFYDHNDSHGLWEIWYNTGHIYCKIYFVNGKKEGLCESWHNNGKLESKGYYINSDKHGLWEEWYDNGQLENQGAYKRGGKEGLWKFFDRNGKTHQQIQLLINNCCDINRI